MAWTEAEVIRLTSEYTASLGASGPVIVRGKGAKVWDIQGEEYLDCESGPGVLNIGHCHPRVTEVIKKQVELMTQTPGVCYNTQIVALAQKLAEISPGTLKKTFFCNSGAESVEGAVKVAMKKAQKSGKLSFGIIAFQNAFHGRLSLSQALTGLTGRKQGFGTFGSFPGVVHIQAPYCYRCPLQYPACDLHCAGQMLEDLLKTSGPGQFAIFIGEPILAVGGIIVPPDGYWAKIREFCDRNGIILIFDEVFAGFGRTGKMFTSQHWGVIPDIMVTAKAVGGGLPLGAFIMKPEIADALASRDHFTTFGWNNVVGPAAGLEGIKVIEEEGLVENSRAMGERMIEGLRAMMDHSDIIGDVRGKGLLIGVELVKDKKSKVPNSEAAKKLVAAMLQRKILLAETGASSNIIRIIPPLPIDKDQVDHVLSTMELALRDIGHPLRAKGAGK